MAILDKAPVQPKPGPGLDVALGNAFDSIYWKQEAHRRDPALAQVVSDLEKAGVPVGAHEWMLAANGGTEPPQHTARSIGGGMAGALPGVIAGTLLGGPVGMVLGGGLSLAGSRLGSQMANPAEAGGSVIPDLLSLVGPRGMGSLAGKLGETGLAKGVVKKGLQGTAKVLRTYRGDTGIAADLRAPGLIGTLMGKGGKATAQAAVKGTAKGGEKALAKELASPVELTPQEFAQALQARLSPTPKVDSQIGRLSKVGAATPLNQMVERVGSPQRQFSSVFANQAPMIEAKSWEQGPVSLISSLLESSTPDIRKLAMQRLEQGVSNGGSVPITLNELVDMLKVNQVVPEVGMNTAKKLTKKQLEEQAMGLMKTAAPKAKKTARNRLVFGARGDMGVPMTLQELVSMLETNQVRGK